MIKCFIFLLLLFFSALAGCQKESPVIATVGDSVIRADEFEMAAKRKASLLGKSSLADSEKNRLLNEMIKRLILHQYAKKQGVGMDKNQLDAEIKRLSDAQLSKAEKKFIANHAEINIAIKGLRSKISKEINISSSDIEAYYRKHIDEFKMPKTTYKIYLIQIRETDDIPHLLKVLNNDPSAFDRIALKDMPPQLREINKNAAFTPMSDFPDEMSDFLKKAEVGRVYGPVKTKRGVFLFKLIAKKPPYVKPLSEVYHEIRHTIFEERIDKTLDAIAEEMKKDMKVNIVKSNG